MKLEEVIEQFREGKKIRRTSWYKLSNISPLLNDKCEYCDGIIIEDIIADDWELVE